MFGRFGRRRFASPAAKGRDEGSVAATATTDLLALLRTIEAAAGQVYARHGLPQHPGHYRRPAAGGAWEPLGDALSPAEKWTLIEAPSEHGRWRYCAYEALGAHSDSPMVRQASAILAACRGLRQRLADHALITPQDLADSLRLGEAWRRLSDDIGPGEPAATPLHFLPPDRD